MEAARDRRLAVGAETRLIYNVGAGLARLGVYPGLILHLYEGQPWEKILRDGVRATRPQTKVVAVQHVPFAWTYISFFPSRRSISAGELPDLLLTTGAGYSAWFREAGVPADRLAVLGAARYEAVPRPAMPAARTVLCCTSIELDEAIELARKAALASQGLRISLIVNFHPITDDNFRSSLREALRGLDHVTFSSRSLRELLEQVDTVLYTGSAGGFDAVQAGRVAIYVARDLALDYDPLPQDIAVRCRSVEELRELLRRPDLAGASRQSPAALERWIEPMIDADALRGLLKDFPRHREAA
jgi:hypothetical protein